MAATAHARRAGRLHSAKEGTARPIHADVIGTHLALLEAHAEEGR
jgi:hypothetical protein